MNSHPADVPVAGDAVRVDPAPVRWTPKVTVRRCLLVYFVAVAIPVLGVAALIFRAAAPDGGSSRPGSGADQLLFHLLLATAVVTAVAALFGAAARVVGQPRVVGELFAGIAFGPSLLGWVAPGFQRWLFPPATFPYLDVLAQFGVIFFMFLIGCELSVGLLRSSGTRGLVVGHASIALPFLAGVVMAWYLRGSDGQGGAPTLSFLLLVGLSFAITAFPVLARILSELGLLGTPLGTTGMAAAGVGDVTAWALLAVVIAIARGTSIAAASTVLLVVVFAVAMVLVVRPALVRLVAASEQRPTARLPMLAGLIFLVLVSAVLTEGIGVHPIFGAFLAGVVMPRDSSLVQELTRKLEGITLWLLLPLFFVSVGLRTDLSGLSGSGVWLIGTVIAVAVSSKIVSAGLAARAMGVDGRDALCLGLMMNCRGLTELIVLNVGLQLGILSPRLFAVFVVMALVTTAMTGPLLRLVRRGVEADVGPGRRVPVAG